MWSAFGLVALWVSNGTPRQTRQVLWAIVAAAAMTGAIAVLTGSTQEASAGATAVSGRASGSFTHPNQLAFFLVMALPPGLVLAVRNRGLLRGVALGAVVVIFVALLLTLTRGAIIGAAFSLAVMLVWLPFRRVAATVLVGLAVFAALNSGALSRSKELNLVGARLATVLDKQQATVNNGRLTHLADRAADRRRPPGVRDQPRQLQGVLARVRPQRGRRGVRARPQRAADDRQRAGDPRRSACSCSRWC